MATSICSLEEGKNKEPLSAGFFYDPFCSRINWSSFKPLKIQQTSTGVY
ncbi:MAG TPA: hypothetical protein PKY12_10420 [Catalimonadaceae bacterium]|nr:hypothetical protein [Catalimonadaceae bacterium]